MFESHTQIICTIFGVHIYFYGIILALAIVTGTFMADYFGTKFFELKKETIIDLSPYLVIFGIIGARIYYCLLNYDFYMRFPTEILAVRHGGMSIHGAIIGGLIGLFIFSKKRKIPAAKLCDVSAIGLALAQSIGRWGNFFNSEAFGYPTQLPWKLYIAPQYRPIPFTDYEYFHPTFLYESLLDFCVFLLLFFAVNKKLKFTQRNGNIALVYLILYSLVRIFVEYFRIDSVCYIHGYPVAMVVSACIIVLSSITLILKNKKRVTA